jgi:N-methylhydantoinase A/oxoprolinase/acetone carboxylase beta subunit
MNGLRMEFGGTLTDIILLDQSSDVPVSRTLKVRSTPKSPERSVLHEIDQLQLNWNVRIPGDTAGEFNAQLTANERGAVDLVTPLEANRMSIFW